MKIAGISCRHARQERIADPAKICKTPGNATGTDAFRRKLDGDILCIGKVPAQRAPKADGIALAARSAHFALMRRHGKTFLMIYDLSVNSSIGPDGAIFLNRRPDFQASSSSLLSLSPSLPESSSFAEATPATDPSESESEPDSDDEELLDDEASPL